VYKRQETDWLLHVDVDEFLRSSDFIAELSSVPDDVDSLTIPNGERVFLRGKTQTIFDGALRRQCPGDRQLVEQTLGSEMAKFTNRGFCGHALGKSITRTGRGIGIGLHHPKLASNARIALAEQTTLVHYDGLTELHWVSKLLRYSGNHMYARPGRKGAFRAAQIDAVCHAGADGIATATRLHDLVKTIDEEQVPELEAFGLIEPLGIDPVREAQQMLGARAPDFSVAAFDAALVAQRSEEPRLASWHTALRAA